MRSVNCMRFYEFSQVPKKCIQQVAVLSLCNSNYIIIIYEVIAVHLFILDSHGAVQ